MIESLLSSRSALSAGNDWVAAVGRALSDAGFPVARFVVGLVGGIAHCTGIRGPFVLTQVTVVAGRAASRPSSELQQLRGALLLPSQIGRLTTCSALGANIFRFTRGVLI